MTETQVTRYYYEEIHNLNTDDSWWEIWDNHNERPVDDPATGLFARFWTLEDAQAFIPGGPTEMMTVRRPVREYNT